jgi:hypothetical protein
MVLKALWLTMLVSFAVLFGVETESGLRHETSLAVQEAGMPPALMLWAWERPEKLEFIDPLQTGVAFLCKTCRLAGDGVMVRPRLHPLLVPEGTYLMAVVRIESDHIEKPALSETQREKLLSVLTRVSQREGIRAVQIDFDARFTQRAFYGALLRELRGRLPPSITLSMTSLASWCMYDDWLTELPVDEVVPMVFRMGPDRRRIHSYLSRGRGFRSRACRESIGVSADETLPRILPGQRVYAFNPKSWNEEAFRRLQEEVHRCR